MKNNGSLSIIRANKICILITSNARILPVFSLFLFDRILGRWSRLFFIEYLKLVSIDRFRPVIILFSRFDCQFHRRTESRGRSSCRRSRSRSWLARNQFARPASCCSLQHVQDTDPLCLLSLCHAISRIIRVTANPSAIKAFLLNFLRDFRTLIEV